MARYYLSGILKGKHMQDERTESTLVSVHKYEEKYKKERAIALLGDITKHWKRVLQLTFKYEFIRQKKRTLKGEWPGLSHRFLILFSNYPILIFVKFLFCTIV